MQIKILKVRDNAKMPSKAHDGDAGYDLFYCPENNEEILLEPGNSYVLPTGIKMSFPNDWMVEIKNKGGMAAKNHLFVGSCVVDSSYRGEVFVNLHNMIIPGATRTMNINFELKPGDKIAQMVPIPIGFSELKQVNSKEFEEEGDTTRGEGCLGSTGDK